MGEKVKEPLVAVVSANEITLEQVMNMANGIGCENCGLPTARMYREYNVCTSKGCMRVLKSIWKANYSARRAGNSWSKIK